jgi:hypothetical protein
MQQAVLRGGAASFGQPCMVYLHLLFFLQGAQGLAKNLRSPLVRRHHYAVVHPFALASRFHDPGASQVGKMPGDLRLRPTEDFHEVAHTDLLISHEVQQPKPCVVPQCLEEAFEVVGLLSCHASCIRIDVCECKPYSRLSVCEEAVCRSSCWIL